MGHFFIRRPIVAMVISIVTVLVGLVSLQRLPVSQYPEITPPEVQVTATYTGADAVSVEQSVATPLEQKVNGVENSIYMRSINANDGSMTLRVAFEVGTNLDINNVLVQNRVSEATPSLPEDVKKFGVAVKKSLSFPLLIVTLRSPKRSYDTRFLNNYASINITDQIARIRGVGQVTLFGGADYAMRVWVSPDRLAQLKLTVPDLTKAIQTQNVIVPGGQIGGPPAPPGQEFTYAVRTNGRLADTAEFGAVIVRTNPDGSQVHLRDVARLELGEQNYNSIARLSGDAAAAIAIYQIPGTNALDVAGQIKKTMEDLKTRFPNDMEYAISLDTTLPVSEGINEIVHTLLEAMVLVILVVFIFLQDWRATLIPLLTVPVSLIGTFAIFPMLGFSINVLSLLGLVLAIGIVVDDAIVVVEAVVHHIEHGMTPKDAANKAMDEVSGPVVAIALVLSAVFVPVAFMGGITGRLYQQFAITIAISVILSAIGALSLSPALSAMLLRKAEPKKGPLGKFFIWFNKVFDKFTGGYVGFTGILVRKMARSMIFIGILCVAIVILGKKIPGGFVPEEDQGYVLANVKMQDATSLQRTDETAKKVEQILMATPGVASVVTITGYSLVTQSYASNTAFFFVTLKPWAERGAAAEHAKGVVGVANATFQRDVPEALAFAFGPPAIPGLGTGAGYSIFVQDRTGETPAALASKTQEFIAAVRKRPEIGNAVTLYSASVPQIFANIDRDKVMTLGLQLQDVNTTIGAFLGGQYINDFNRFGRLYKVYVQAEPQYRATPDQLQFFYVRNAKGEMVPLSTFVHASRTNGPEYTNRFNLYRAAEVTGGPAPGYSSAQALQALKEVGDSVLVPAGFGYQFNAMSYQEEAAAGKGAVVFGMALVFVFLILAAQYESWSLPFSVLLGTPFAVFGAFLGLWLARLISPSYENNVFAQIGLVMLIGLAAKNAILIVEFARAKLHEGMELIPAAMEAAKLRFRPILMTAFAFILGVVPLLTASGAGAEARKVMGMAVFSGMLIATIFGVLLVPVLFVLIEKLSGGGKKAPAAAPAATASGGH